MPNYTDQTGHTIFLPGIPQRIVSLVPSQTELLYHLGLDERVQGITKFCVHPKEWFSSKLRIGGTKSVNIEKILSLKPGLIIANKEENVQEQVLALAEKCPVWTSDISNLQEALQMIEAIGNMTGTMAKALEITAKINACFTTMPAQQTNIRTAYLVWQNPYMSIGADTFIHDMLARCGLYNIFQDRQRYPAVTIQEIKDKDCQLLLLSSEPFPFKQQHIDALRQQLPATKIMLADGEMFSWYGSRLLLAPVYFRELLSGIMA